MKTCSIVFVMLALIGIGGAALSLDKSQTDRGDEAKSVSAGENGSQTKDGDNPHIIGHLEKRDRIVTIKSGPDGRVYSVATRDGKVLHENLSAEQLKAEAPELHELIETGVAGDARARRCVLDASVKIPSGR